MSDELKYVSIAKIVRHLVENESEFVDALSKKLMLDELLCGEANPKQFLIESMHEVINDKLVSYHKRRLSEIGGES